MRWNMHESDIENVQKVFRVSNMLNLTLTVIILANFAAHSVCSCDIAYLMKFKCLVVKYKILMKNISYK